MRGTDWWIVLPWEGPMHIPDGFLSAPVWATMDAVSLPAVGYLARRAQRETEETRIPLLGVMGAFVFAAQMINFPVGPGTSGHLVGGALLSYTLGPAAASVVMTAILAIQALIFQDGGVLALGANVFNMAILGVLAAWLPFHFWGAGRLRKLAIFSGAALSVLAGACLAITQLLASGVPMKTAVLGVSLAVFAVTALLEAAITVAVMQAIEALNPAWVRRSTGSGGRALAAISVGAVLLACVGVLFASRLPDGLERLAGQLGLVSQTRTVIAAPLADYEARVFESEWLRKASAGVAGLALIYGVCAVLGRVARRR